MCTGPILLFRKFKGIYLVYMIFRYTRYIEVWYILLTTFYFPQKKILEKLGVQNSPISTNNGVAALSWLINNGGRVSKQQWNLGDTYPSDPGSEIFLLPEALYRILKKTSKSSFQTGIYEQNIYLRQKNSGKFSGDTRESTNKGRHSWLSRNCVSRCRLRPNGKC